MNNGYGWNRVIQATMERADEMNRTCARLAAETGVSMESAASAYSDAAKTCLSDSAAYRKATEIIEREKSSGNL